MKKYFVLILCLFMLTACARQETEESFITQVSADESKEESSVPETPKEVPYIYEPSADEKMRGVWISQYDITSVWCSKEGQTPVGDFAYQINSICSELKEKGYTDIFVQLRPFGDSFYPSRYFPPSAYAVGAYGNGFEYDPLSIFVSAAHTHGLKFHAWLNPFRLVEEKQLSLLPQDSVIVEYASNGKLALYNGRYYLLPSDTDCRNLVLNGIREILENYDVDGIHFDDYFYPTKDESFDAADFSESQSNDLFEWRRENISSFVKEAYNLVKSVDSECVFGIAPSGNLKYTYETCCTDVYKWCSEEGYVDYIMPQIYFGYYHETAPFLPIADNWMSLVKTSAVKLYIGLSAYKRGTEDANAGTGKNEWIENPNLINEQAQDCIDYTDGYVMISYSYID